MSTSIHQEVIFKASPIRIYATLTSSEQFSKATGAPADISTEVGGPFSCFGGHVVGRNLELLPNHRIVQAWRPANWPEGIYSIVRFELKEQGSETLLIFDQTGIPEGQCEHLDPGWKDNYWTALEKYLG